MRRKSIQVSVELIVEAAGALEQYRQALAQNGSFFLVVKNEPYQDFQIETAGKNRVAIAHTYVEGGDTQFDPEIVFETKTWNAVEITQSPVRRQQKAGPGRYLPGANSLAGIWAANLRHQGFTDPERSTYRVIEE
jgi:hypothetical protein